MSKKNNKRNKLNIGSGNPCKKCGDLTVIRKRITPPKDKNFYYKKWEFCQKCNAVYFKEEDKSTDWQEDERQQSFLRNL